MNRGAVNRGGHDDPDSEVTPGATTDAPVDVVDFRVRLPAEFRRNPARASADQAGRYQRYDEVLGVFERIDKTTATLLAELRASNVSHAVVHAEYEHGEQAGELNDATAGLVNGSAGLLSGFGTVDLHERNLSTTVREINRCARLGLAGINIQPAFFGRAIDDRELYPIYAASAAEGLAVAVHTGVNYDRSCPIDGEQPVRLDRVATAFPELTLIASHAAWPWATELAAVARRHPAVNFDFGGLAPRYLGRSDTGWQTLLRLTDTVLREQALFATDWPVIDHRRAVDEWSEVPLRDVTRAAVLAGNARRLLRLPADPGVNVPPNHPTTQTNSHVADSGRSQPADDRP